MNSPVLNKSNYIDALLREKSYLTHNFHMWPNTIRLINQDLKNSQNIGEPFEPNYLDLYCNTDITLQVLVPIQKNPKYKATTTKQKDNYIKHLEDRTQCLVRVLSKGSMEHSDKEELCPTYVNAKYLFHDLHILVMTTASPATAYTRIGCALDILQKSMIPEYVFDVTRGAEFISKKNA